jgi:uncharacterized protein YcbK (DUF882 family)
VRTTSAFIKAVVFVAALVFGVPAVAAPRGASHGRGTSVVKAKAKAKATRKKTARRGRKRRPVFRGHGVFNGLREAPLPRPSGNIHLYSVNFRDEVKVNIFRPDGSYDEDAIMKLNYFVRSRGAGTERMVEPRLYEILSLIYDHYGGRVLEFVSGFRDQPRATSYHYLASAMDMRVRGVSIRTLRNYVKTLDTGGMGLGIYPRTGFIHVDVRPEPSYYWTDWSGHSRGRKKARRKVPRS